MLLGGPARADVAPPDTSACAALSAGAACVYNGTGTCQNSTCSKLDYANWDRDASASPPSMNYACLKCIPDTDTATSTTTATSTITTAGIDGGTSPSADDSACAIGKQVTAKRVAPWLLAGSFSLLFVLARRRRRS